MEFGINYYCSCSQKEKETKSEILSQFFEKEQSNKRLVLVSTQVVEAVTQVYREKAPLDNIIQVMERLNRELETNESRLTVFEFGNDGDDFRPHSQLTLRWS